MCVPSQCVSHGSVGVCLPESVCVPVGLCVFLGVSGCVSPSQCLRLGGCPSVCVPTGPPAWSPCTCACPWGPVGARPLESVRGSPWAARVRAARSG